MASPVEVQQRQVFVRAKVRIADGFFPARVSRLWDRCRVLASRRAHTLSPLSGTRCHSDDDKRLAETPINTRSLVYDHWPILSLPTDSSSMGRFPTPSLLPNPLESSEFPLEMSSRVDHVCDTESQVGKNKIILLTTPHHIHPSTPRLLIDAALVDGHKHCQFYTSHVYIALKVTIHVYAAHRSLVIMASTLQDNRARS